jgi:hypothetical protein
MRPTTRPDRYTQPEPEDLFNVTVVFNDDEPPVRVTEVKESEVVSMYEVLGQPDARARFQTSPGNHYFTAANRIKHITATLINETSN